MDSTIIDAEGIVELARANGAGDYVEQVTIRTMNGELNFENALKERVKLIGGLPEKAAKEVAENVPLMTGAEKLITELKSMGYRTALVSAGFTIIADLIGRKLGMDHVCANELVIQDGRATGEVRGPLTKQNSKKEVLENICKLENIDPRDCIAVGDGSNDLCWVGVVGTFIAFNAKPVVKRAADVVVEGKDLGSLIPIVKQEEDKRHAKRTAR
nr:phosphoserine phosphatase SerB [Methanocella sp. CWC-04]